MPAPPEFLQARRKIRLAEVDHEVEAHQLGAAARDIAITAEVSVNLPGEGVRPEKNDPEVGLSKLAAKRRVRQQRAIVSNHAFANEPRNNQHEAVKKAVRVETAILLNLRKKMPGPLNWAGDQMGKQADEQSVFDKRFRRCESAFIDVHNVGDFLKRIERDAGRKKDTDQRQGNIVDTERAKHRGKRIHEEIEILERSENGKIHDQRKDEPFPAVDVSRLRSDSLRDQKIDQRAANHEGEESPVPPSVEEVAGAQQKDVLLAAAQAPIDEHDGNQKDKIDRRIKEHGDGRVLSFCRWHRKYGQHFRLRANTHGYACVAVW